LSLDDFVITAFVTGPGATTLPLLVFSSVKLGVSPEINALGTVIVGVAAVVTLSSTLLQRRGSAA
jgi:putrescine transport system permease protein